MHLHTQTETEPIRSAIAHISEFSLRLLNAREHAKKLLFALDLNVRLDFWDSVCTSAQQ